MDIFPPRRKGFPGQWRLRQDNLGSCINLQILSEMWFIEPSVGHERMRILTARLFKDPWMTSLLIDNYGVPSALPDALQRHPAVMPSEIGGLAVELSTLHASLDAGLRSGFSTAHNARLLGSLPCSLKSLATFSSSVLLGVLLQGHQQPTFRGSPSFECL